MQNIYIYVFKSEQFFQCNHLKKDGVFRLDFLTILFICFFWVRRRFCCCFFSFFFLLKCIFFFFFIILCVCVCARICRLMPILLGLARHWMKIHLFENIYLLFLSGKYLYMQFPFFFLLLCIRSSSLLAKQQNEKKQKKKKCFHSFVFCISFRFPNASCIYERCLH